MTREYRKWHSPALSREMELLVFGDAGTPVIAFPTSRGRFYQWEDFGLIGHMQRRIDARELQVWCVDSVDDESFYARQRTPAERVARHVAYEDYILDEVVPQVRAVNAADGLIYVGASFGAYHAGVFGTRRPGFARKVLCLSGAFDTGRVFGDLAGADYYVNPIAFLPGLADEHYLAPMRQTEFVVVTGDEDPNTTDSRRFVELLREKGVPARFHLWPGWGHDWNYWMEMTERYL